MKNSKKKMEKRVLVYTGGYERAMLAVTMQ